MMNNSSSSRNGGTRPNPNASFFTQANALLRKNLTFQKRNFKTNLGLIAFPVFLCLLLAIIQSVANKFLASQKKIDCNTEQSFTTDSEDSPCPIPSPPKWPALMEVPYLESCRGGRKGGGSCNATVLLTGSNRSFAEGLAGNLFPSGLSLNSSLNSSDVLETLAELVLGTSTIPAMPNFMDPAFSGEFEPLYVIQSQCPPKSAFSVQMNISSIPIEKEVRCVQGLSVWRNSSSIVNDELFKVYQQGNTEGKTNKIIAAYDLLNSNDNNFNVNIWYKSIQERPGRTARSVNVVSNAYLQILKGVGAKILLDFVKEMPKPPTNLPTLDFSSLLGPLFFTWVILQLFPVILTSLVYEKQQNLRIMMKMHGLSDGPYWMISYAYFLFISSAYMLCFVLFGSGAGLKFFTANNYGIQFLFHFIYVNLQIAFAFLVATIFSKVKTATVIAHLYVFGSGLSGIALFQQFIEDASLPRRWIIAMEIFPGFSLYRGLYEFGQYTGVNGMQWKDLNSSTNGMKEVLIIMLIEWFIFLVIGYYFDQVLSIGSGVRRHPLFFLQNSRRKPVSSSQRPSLERQGSKVVVQMDRPDVYQEGEKVEQLLLEPNTSHAVICDNLRKIYPGRDGNPEKLAVQGLSLALPRGECFGILGPNGAGKTSFISMMIGLTMPTSGTAFIHGLDIRTEMDKIYTSMGVCPQHDLLWETLTGREHLLFYGRLKNLKGAALKQAVDESLRSGNLFNGGVGDKQAGKYSGGMKRRLSVAISLIGDPKVVYMDEPSTGLDPASRNCLWNVVKRAKKDRAIILTTHSMEEAEALCDRLGIFVDGSLQCIGNPTELKGRYGGSYVLTMTTTSGQEEEVENLAHQLTPNAKKIYHISGTQKFELPKGEVRIADVFRAVENAKSRFTIQAWGLADTTLEDVFIKVAAGAQAFNVLS